MSDPTSQDGGAPGSKAASPAMTAVAVVLLAVPIAGIAVNVAMFVWADPDLVVSCYRNHAPVAVCVAALLIFAISLMQEKRIRTQINLAAEGEVTAWQASIRDARGPIRIGRITRVACFLWLASIALVVPGIYAMLHEMFT